MKNNHKKATISITEIKQVKGFIHPNSIYSGNANKYNGSKNLTSLHYEPIALFVKGIDEEGKELKFYTPTIILTVTKGFLNYTTMKKNSWFDQVEKEMISVKGAPMFDGGNSMNVAIQNKSEIKPKINVGDKIKITYSMTNSKINRVKINNTQ